MNKLTKQLISALLSVALLPQMAVAEDFDFSSQRGEVKTVKPVPGSKLDHHGIIINPTPQEVSRPYTGVLNLSGGFKVKDKKKAFASDLGFLQQQPGGIELVIDFGKKEAAKAGVKNIDGAYLLDIGPKKVTITGYNERGAFYGLQTLRQILQSPTSHGGQELPMMVINDYPSMKYRGVVEGFYGTPWSHKVRMSLIDFYGQNKLCDYLYGPKDDPYHSSPYWRQPYPEQEAKNIHELVENAKRNHVNFIWAIHPGKDIRWNKADYDSLVNKFNMMYDLGVRSFAIFFDDIDGEGTNPKKQVELLNNLTNDFVKQKGDVTNLIICPTDYSQLWAKPGPDGPLAVYGRELNPDVEVFWTGAVVCSDLTPETLEFINSRIKRPALYWWNYPVTDYCKHILMQGPVYGLDTTLTSNEVVGVVSNPMEHGEASKLALYGVADYTWNTPAYNPIDNWERGLVELMPKAHDAYRTFAIHSTDTETGYRRDESWETVTFPYNDYTPEQFNALRNEFEKIVKVEDEIVGACENPGLLDEMRPWLAEFTKLGKRGLSTLNLIKTFEQGNDSIFWSAFLANQMSDDAKKSYNAHKVGTMKLQPFYEKAMDGMLKAFYRNVSGEAAAIVGGVGTFPYFKPEQVAKMLDADSTTFYTTEEAQTPGAWLGLDLQDVRPVDEVFILQGRNSVDDGDYMDNMIVEYSADGNTWLPLSPELAKTYRFEWKSEEPVMARFVRMRRLDSDRKSWAAVRTFAVNPLTVDRIGNNLDASNPSDAIKAFDKNPLTYSSLSGTISFDRLQGANHMTLLMDDVFGPVTVSQFDAKGREVSQLNVTTAYASVPLSPKATRIVVKGHTKLFEVIQR
ncbi:MAG: beta-N-acetylglucosaminidase domain-containing protein [Firmicutes bacterium]|nr:beta-N-acetylglucosaminidase domain-containing protein [Bacillota bacterium]MCM1400883.1 beta-N-acetylglucosaminidase domain-containing protein [Bacteroides sp.]MCM1476283.1 beta-N-acetylglucosaminidase domain-containing protein [Bacteroides sp.]